MKWNQTADSLPENERKVLAVTQTKKGEYNYVMAYYSHEFERWVSGMNSNVVAWMDPPAYPDVQEGARYRVAPEAEEKAFSEIVVTREQRRRIQNMKRDELTRYLIHLYRDGFEDGIDTLQEELAQKVEKDALPFEEVSVDWEDVLAVIGQVRGIGPGLLQRIDKKLREEY